MILPCTELAATKAAIEAKLLAAKPVYQKKEYLPQALYNINAQEYREGKGPVQEENVYQVQQAQ